MKDHNRKSLYVKKLGH